MQTLSEALWETFEQRGVVRLGKLLSDEELNLLQDEIDAIMLGEASVDYDQLMMQLDTSSGDYGDLGGHTDGFKGATLNYRKIQDLELDAVFLRYMQRPLFRNICTRVYGERTPIDCFRAMFMNKPAQHGTLLPWHQDRWSHLDRDPQITVWTALDKVTEANGCMQIVHGSHKLGVINPDHKSAFLTEKQAQETVSHKDIEFLEVDAGEVVLLHNWTLHRSDTNRTDGPRRAFSVCYMDGRTKSPTANGYRCIFGPDALDPQTLPTGSRE